MKRNDPNKSKILLHTSFKKINKSAISTGEDCTCEACNKELPDECIKVTAWVDGIGKETEFCACNTYCANAIRDKWAKIIQSILFADTDTRFD